jgi:hypothetical protein
VSAGARWANRFKKLISRDSLSLAPYIGVCRNLVANSRPEACKHD